MVRCVRLCRGEWKKNGEEEWDFERDPGDFGYRMLIRRNASYEELDQILRHRYCLSPHTPVVVSYRLPSWMLVPHGNKTPPMTISNTQQLWTLLNVRAWMDELALLVTIGAKGVAEYQFLCRTDFRIGATTYVVDETATENSRAAYESLVFGDRAAQTERVMNAIFPEEGMLLFHRVSLEMAHADNLVANGRRGNPPEREVIELDDDDDEMAEAVAGVGGNSDGVEVQVTQEGAPPIFWDVGMNVCDFQAPGVLDNPFEAGDEMRFWEEVANQEFGGADEINGVIPVGDENVRLDNVGGVHADGENISRDLGIGEGVQDDGDGSSTGSTNATLARGGHPVQIPEDVLEATICDPLMTSVVDEEGLELASPTNVVDANMNAVVDSGVDVTMQPMMKLAICCAKDVGGTSRAHGGNVTSTEESSNDGCFFKL